VSDPAAHSELDPAPGADQGAFADLSLIALIGSQAQRVLSPASRTAEMGGREFDLHCGGAWRLG
jgi:hypothetical protein